MAQSSESAVCALPHLERGAGDSMRFTTKAQLSLRNMQVILAKAESSELHEASFEPSAYLQIGYLLECEPEDRSVRFLDVRGTSHYTPLGSLFIIPPHTPFKTRCGPVNNTGIFCYLDPSCEGAVFDEDIWRRANVLDVATNIRSPELKRAMNEIAGEVDHAGWARELAVEYLASLAMVHLGRHIGEYTSSRGVLPAWRVRRIEEMVRDHVGQPLQIGDIAKSCGISNSHLMRAYKKTTGRTIGQLIEDARIDRAKALLRDSLDTVTTIAEKLNYSSRPHFAAAFRRAEGVSPLSYRQTCAKPASAAGLRVN